MEFIPRKRARYGYGVRDFSGVDTKIGKCIIKCRQCPRAWVLAQAAIEHGSVETALRKAATEKGLRAHLRSELEEFARRKFRITKRPEFLKLKMRSPIFDQANIDIQRYCEQGGPSPIASICEAYAAREQRAERVVQLLKATGLRSI